MIKLFFVEIVKRKCTCVKVTSEVSSSCAAATRAIKTRTENAMASFILGQFGRETVDENENRLKKIKEIKKMY